MSKGMLSVSSFSTRLLEWQNPHLKLQPPKNIMQAILPSQSIRVDSLNPLITGKRFGSFVSRIS